MREIGDVLRRQREARGVSLREAQAATKIRLKYLEALEAGDEAAFPGEVYMRGFLRSYADYLGLDGWALVAQYRAYKEAQALAREAEAATRVPRRRRRGGGSTPTLPPGKSAPAQAPEPPSSGAPGTEGPSSGGAAQSIAPPAREPPAAGRLPRPAAERRRFPSEERGEGLGRAAPRPLQPLARPLSPRLPLILGTAAVAVAMAALIVARALLPSAPDTGVPAPPPAAAPGPGGGTSTGSPAQTPAPASGEAPAPPPGPPPVTVRLVSDAREQAEYLVTEAALRLELLAQERCWIQVEVDGALASQETLLPGESRSFEARERLWLRAGNPGGLMLTANGAGLGPAGEDGIPRNLIFLVRPGG
ncbi:MAG: DUF4115 domain-containing protein [Acetobacteraceae bacterium]|nr:DUF4115 domain-containing protein [Acetobacteraceae bacterium]